MLKRLKEWSEALRKSADTPLRGPAEEGEAVRGAQPLILYYRLTCPFCIRVFIALRSLDVSVERRNITVRANACRELLAGGGRQMVPCLRIEEPDGTRWLYESGDIIAYLERRFPVRE